VLVASHLNGGRWRRSYLAQKVWIGVHSGLLSTSSTYSDGTVCES
jgi:hypothetical protein